MDKDVNLQSKILSKAAKRRAKAAAAQSNTTKNSTNSTDDAIVINADSNPNSTVISIPDSFENSFSNADDDSISHAEDDSISNPNVPDKGKEVMDVDANDATLSSSQSPPRDAPQVNDDVPMEIPPSEGVPKERAGIQMSHRIEVSTLPISQPISIPKDISEKMKDISESSTMRGSSIRMATDEEPRPRCDEQILTFHDRFSIRLPCSKEPFVGPLTPQMAELHQYLMTAFGLTDENAEEIIRARYQPSLPIVAYLLYSTNGPQPKFPIGMELNDATLLNSILDIPQMSRFLQNICRDFLSPLRHAIFAQNDAVEQVLRFGGSELIRIRESISILTDRFNQVMDGVLRMDGKITTTDHIQNSLSAVHHNHADLEDTVSILQSEVRELDQRIQAMHVLVHAAKTDVDEMKNSSSLTTSGRLKRLEEFMKQCEGDLPLSSNHVINVMQTKIESLLESVHVLRNSIRELNDFKDTMTSRMTALEQRVNGIFMFQDQARQREENMRKQHDDMQKNMQELRDENNRLKRKYNQIDDILSRLAILEKGCADSPMHLDTPEPADSTHLPHSISSTQAQDSIISRDKPDSTMPSPFMSTSQSSRGPKSAFILKDFSTSTKPEKQVISTDDDATSTSPMHTRSAFMPRKYEQMPKSYDSIVREGEQKELPTQRVSERQRMWKKKEDIDKKDFYRFCVKNSNNSIPDFNGEPDDIQPPADFIRDFIWKVDGDPEILSDMTAPFTGNDPDLPPQWEFPYFYFVLWMTGFHNFNWGLPSPISIKVAKNYIQHPNDIKVANELGDKVSKSLILLRRIVKFTNTGFWISMDGCHESFNELWSRYTRLLFLHQFGHFLYTYYEYQFTNVSMLFHVSTPQMPKDQPHLLHVGIKYHAECTLCHKSAFWTFWGFPFHTKTRDGESVLYTHQCISNPDAMTTLEQLRPLILILFWTHWIYDMMIQKMQIIPGMPRLSRKFRELCTWDDPANFDTIMKRYRCTRSSFVAYMTDYSILVPPLPVDKKDFDSIDQPEDIKQKLQLLNLPNVWVVPDQSQALDLHVTTTIGNDSIPESSTSTDKGGKGRRPDSMPPQSRGRAPESEWKDVGRSKSKPRDSKSESEETEFLYQRYVEAAFGKGKGGSKGGFAKGKGKGKGWSGTLPPREDLNISTDTPSTRETISTTPDSIPERQGRQDERQNTQSRSRSWASYSSDHIFSDSDDDDFRGSSNSGRPRMPTKHSFNWKKTQPEWEPEFVRNDVIAEICVDPKEYVLRYGFDANSMGSLTPNVSSYYIPFLGLQFSSVQSMKHFWLYRYDSSRKEFLSRQWNFNKYRYFWTINGWKTNAPRSLFGGKQKMINAQFDAEKSIEKEMFGTINDADLRKSPEDLLLVQFDWTMNKLKDFHLRDLAIIGFLDMEFYLDPMKPPGKRSSDRLLIEISLCLSETIALDGRMMMEEFMQNRYDPITHSITWHIKYQQFREDVGKFDSDSRKTNQFLFENVLGISMPHACFSTWRSDQPKDSWRVITELFLTRAVEYSTFKKEFTTVLESMLMPFLITHAAIAYKGGDAETNLLRECGWKGTTIDLEDFYCPSFDVVPGQVLSMFPECGCNFHMPMNAIEKKCAFQSSSDLYSTIEWPPMGIYNSKKNQWKWQHCPLREVCFLRWWTSRYYPFTMPIYPCIALTLNSFDPQWKSLYDWELHRHHAYTFCKKAYAMNAGRDPTIVEAWDWHKDVCDEDMREFLRNRKFYIQDYGKFLNALRYAKKHTVHSLCIPDPHKFKDIMGDAATAMVLGGDMKPH